MDGIWTTLTEYLSHRASQLGFVEPRLAEHDLRAEQVERVLPAVGRGRRCGRIEFEHELDQGYGGEAADGGHVQQVFH
jgi:hypothetical protein